MFYKGLHEIARQIWTTNKERAQLLLRLLDRVLVLWRSLPVIHGQEVQENWKVERTGLLERLANHSQEDDRKYVEYKRQELKLNDALDEKQRETEALRAQLEAAAEVQRKAESERDQYQQENEQLRKQVAALREIKVAQDDLVLKSNMEVLALEATAQQHLRENKSLAAQIEKLESSNSQFKQRTLHLSAQAVIANMRGGGSGNPQSWPTPKFNDDTASSQSQWTHSNLSTARMWPDSDRSHSDHPGDNDNPHSHRSERSEYGVDSEESSSEEELDDSELHAIVESNLKKMHQSPAKQLNIPKLKIDLADAALLMTAGESSAGIPIPHKSPPKASPRFILFIFLCVFIFRAISFLSYMYICVYMYTYNTYLNVVYIYRSPSARSGKKSSNKHNKNKKKNSKSTNNNKNNSNTSPSASKTKKTKKTSPTKSTDQDKSADPSSLEKSPKRVGESADQETTAGVGMNEETMGLSMVSVRSVKHSEDDTHRGAQKTQAQLQAIRPGRYDHITSLCLSHTHTHIHIHICSCLVSQSSGP